jgi:DNA primase
MGIKPSVFTAIKAAPLSTVVEKLGGKLKRVGHEFLTQCLWHEDTNPSLTISDQKGFCFCHVCRGGGDAVDYVRKAKGLDFFDAAEFTAGLLGVQFETDDEDPEALARRKKEKKRESDLLHKEHDKYRENLKDPRAGRIREILKNRGLTPEASKEFGLGYSSGGFFGGRITIPIYNHRDQLVGFTGRATKEDQLAKYKNSADGILFNKKTLLFNEQKAYAHAIEAGSIIFVEGHLDVVAMWQAGIKNVVAAQGTSAPDPLVLQRLSRNIRNLILCFDGDTGGSKAVGHFLQVAGPMALRGEVNINVVSLPEGKDPDDVIRSGDNLYNYISAAPSWLDWTIDDWAAGLDKNDSAMMTAVEDRLRGLINGLRSKALRTHYVDKAARVLGSTDKEAQEIAKSWGSAHFVTAESSWSPREPHQIRLAAERRLIRIFVHKPDLRDDLREMMGNVTNPALKWLCNRLQELEDCSQIDLTPHSVMAVVAVSEPHYLEQLRTLVQPNVLIDYNDGVLSHLADIMLKDLSCLSNESNPD